MKLLKTLFIQLPNEEITVKFGIPETNEEVLKAQELRYKIYNKYGYLDTAQFSNNVEYDQYDTDDTCVYFVASINDQYVGFIRLIQADKLPIFNSFSFEIPTPLEGLPSQEIAEIGRLVVDKYKEDVRLPRNIILLFLTLCVTKYCEEKRITYVYAFIKRKLLDKLDKLRLPYTKISPFKVIYPNNGPMNPYFYNSDDSVEPVYLSLEKMTLFIEKIITDQKMFEIIDTNSYKLHKNMYTNFLGLLGII